MTILGYRERPLKIVNENGDEDWDFDARSYVFDSILPTARGMIATAALMLCEECRNPIKSMGGPGHHCYCLECYDILKIRDFAEGHVHELPKEPISSKGTWRED